MHRCSSVEHFFSLPNNHNGIETFTVGLLRCKTKLTYSNNIFILLSVCLMLIIAPMVKCQRANDNDNVYNYRAMWFGATTAAKFWSSWKIVRERQMISSERIWENLHLSSITHSNQTHTHTYKTIAFKSSNKFKLSVVRSFISFYICFRAGWLTKSKQTVECKHEYSHLSL